MTCPPSISVVTLSMQVAVTPSYSVQGNSLAISDGAPISVRDLKGGQEALMPMVALPDPIPLSPYPPSAVSSPFGTFSPPRQVSLDMSYFHVHLLNIGFELSPLDSDRLSLHYRSPLHSTPHTHIYTYIHTYIHTRTHTHTYTYTQTHTHIYTYTRTITLTHSYTSLPYSPLPPDAPCRARTRTAFFTCPVTFPLQRGYCRPVYPPPDYF